MFLDPGFDASFYFGLFVDIFCPHSYDSLFKIVHKLMSVTLSIFSCSLRKVSIQALAELCHKF